MTTLKFTLDNSANNPLFVNVRYLDSIQPTDWNTFITIIGFFVFEYDYKDPINDMENKISNAEDTKKYMEKILKIYLNVEYSPGPQTPLLLNQKFNSIDPPVLGAVVPSLEDQEFLKTLMDFFSNRRISWRKISTIFNQMVPDSNVEPKTAYLQWKTIMDDINYLQYYIELNSGFVYFMKTYDSGVKNKIVQLVSNGLNFGNIDHILNKYVPGDFRSIYKLILLLSTDKEHKKGYELTSEEVNAVSEYMNDVVEKKTDWNDIIERYKTIFNKYTEYTAKDLSDSWTQIITISAVQERLDSKNKAFISIWKQYYYQYFADEGKINKFVENIAKSLFKLDYEPLTNPEYEKISNNEVALNKLKEIINTYSGDLAVKYDLQYDLDRVLIELYKRITLPGGNPKVSIADSEFVITLLHFMYNRNIPWDNILTKFSMPDTKEQLFKDTWDIIVDGQRDNDLNNENKDFVVLMRSFIKVPLFHFFSYKEDSEMMQE